ncbi:unnamed protein product [Leuciscus chuanchicus]
MEWNPAVNPLRNRVGGKEVCPHGHLVWKWVSQPQFKHGMLAGDYMLAINILLSGNNYRKISLLFDFMKLGMVDRSSFYRIQDAYCVHTIEEFWTEKRNEVIAQVQSKGPVVVLGTMVRCPAPVTVTGEHEWALGACQHGQLPEDRDKAWLKKGSEAHSRLTELVLDARWLKNVHKFLNFR